MCEIPKKLVVNSTNQIYYILNALYYPIAGFYPLLIQGECHGIHVGCV